MGRLTETQIQAISAYVADWWAERLRSGDRETFRQHLQKAVAAELLKAPERPWLSLECDYDPRGILLEAVRAAGVECRGFLFSADGILPRKHSTEIFPARAADPKFDEPAQPHRLIVKEGYGNWREPIPLTDLFASLDTKGEGE